MGTIKIHAMVSSNPLLERIHMFPGRSLGETEFDRQQSYTDFRLQQAAYTVTPGIIKGLEILSGEQLSPWVSIGPGQAVDAHGQVIGLSHSIRQSWAFLIRQYQSESGVQDAQGIYYLSIRRSSDRIDGSPFADSCRQTYIEPHRDIQKVVKGELCLKRLAVSQSLLNLPAERIANHICALQIDQNNFSFMNHSIPVALLGIVKEDDFFSVKWLNITAGRYLAHSDNLYATLSRQVQKSINDLQQRYLSSPPDHSFNDFFEQQTELNFLPAAGQLPLSLLENAQSFIYTTAQGDITRGPVIRFLPSHHNIDMIPVPESSVPAIMQRELQRGYIDLNEPGQSIRLLLAVNDQDYRKDLLDFPAADKAIENALYQYFMKAHNAWHAWKKQFYKLYYVIDKTALSPEQFESLQIPRAVRFPVPAKTFFQNLINQEKRERHLKNLLDLPLPYRNGIPDEPEFYQQWLKNGKIPLPPRPDSNGLSAQLILNNEAIEATQNSIRSKGRLLEKTRDLLVLQRQQLDQNTVAMATLAGGIASDGSGMQIARWWPHLNFETEDTNTEKNNKEDDNKEDDNSVKKTNSATGWIASTMMYTPILNSVIASDTTTTLKPSSVNTIKGPYFTDFNINRKFTPYSGVAGYNTPLFDYTQKIDPLNKVFSQAKAKVSDVQFMVNSNKFGVLKHLEPEKNEYTIAYEGLKDLYRVFKDIYGEKDFKNLTTQLNSIYIPKTPDTISPEGSNNLDKKIQGKTNQELFRISRVLTKFIDIIESRNSRLENDILTAQKQLIQLQARHAQLLQNIQVETRILAKLNNQRLESLSDYNMTQSLLKEEWQRVEDRHEQRNRILGSLKGLYYVKVRRTPVSRAVTAITKLYAEQEDSILAACKRTKQTELPEALDYFLDAVLEIPVSQWQALANSRKQLVNIKTIEKVQLIRQSRISTLLNNRMSSIASPFINLGQHNQLLMADFAQRSIDFKQSSRQIIEQAQNTLSLQDVAQLKTGILKTRAIELKDQLNQCILCLLDNLYQLSPAIRLQWAQLAEDDQLIVEQFKLWPGLQISDRDDIEPVKNIRSLVQWWFRQFAGHNSSKVSSQSSTLTSASFSSLRNMIRAIIIESAYGNPASIIEGKIHVIPPVFLPGQILRLKLNRPAVPGLKLDILSPAQTKVGQLVVEDDDDQGTIARIINTVKTDLQITTQFSVIETSGRTIKTDTGTYQPWLQNYRH